MIGVAGLFQAGPDHRGFLAAQTDRDALEKVYRTIGRNPAECLFIGDRYDIDLRLPADLGSAVFSPQAWKSCFPLIN